MQRVVPRNRESLWSVVFIPANSSSRLLHLVQGLSTTPPQCRPHPAAARRPQLSSLVETGESAQNEVARARKEKERG